MKRLRWQKQPLLQPWLNWSQLPESVRERAIEVLTALCLEILAHETLLEPNDHDQLPH
jgi:hypothetical protein